VSNGEEMSYWERGIPTVQRPVNVIVNGLPLVEVFAQNDPLPAVKAIVFTTVEDSQQQLELRVSTFSEAPNEENFVYFIKGLSGAPRGTMKVEVLFELGVQGKLFVAAKELPTGNILKVLRVR
jgi:molecular chaperone DnaK (HSP70)